MGLPGHRDTKRTFSLSLDDLKQYQENQKALKDENEIVVQASHDTAVCYEVVFERGHMVS